MKVCKRLLILAAISLVVASGAALERAWAWGAIAVGTSGDFGKDGFAFGGSVNQSSEDGARSAAMETCHKFAEAPKMATLCNIISTFHGQCYALAFDPQAGKPGTGWAIAADQGGAEQQAMANCQATAGADRRQYCKVNQSFCDTHD